MMKIFFCFPYRGIGGVPLVFLSVAKELVGIHASEIYVVDYEDGCMAINHDSDLLTLVPYEDGKEVWLPKDAIIVFQSMTPWSIYPSLRVHPETRIFFWNLHPFNLVPTLPGFRELMQSNMAFGKLVLATLLRPYRRKMRKLVKRMIEKKSLIFMDTTNLKITQDYLQLELGEQPFLPVPVAASEKCKNVDTFDPTLRTLRVAWIGRICDFKYFILKHTLELLDEIQQKGQINLQMTVVGTGEYYDKLKCEVAKLKALDVNFVEFIAPEKVEAFLLGEVDVLTAMGTSALEGAKLGIPTILLDIFYSNAPKGYVFKWLHERSGFTLGDVVGPDRLKGGENSLELLFDEALGKYRDISARTAQYFCDNHEAKSASKRLYSFLKHSTFTYGDLQRGGGTERGVLYSSFDVLRNFKRKIFG
jgi:hypothetical protein